MQGRGNCIEEEFARLVSKFGIGVAHRPEATIRCQLLQPKDPIPLNRKSGVIYRIDCRCGRANYVGETGKRGCTRMHEHELAVRRKDKLSLVAAHASSPGHEVDFGSVRILGQSDDRISRFCGNRGTRPRNQSIDISIFQLHINPCANKSMALMKVIIGRVTNGVKHGCVLAPNLFSRMLYVMLMDAYRDEQPGICIAFRTDGHLNSRHMQASTRVSTITVHELLFADDCTLNTVMEEEDMKRSMDFVVAGCANFGLTISTAKRLSYTSLHPARNTMLL
ncbi:unnamed protein product [Schistocephalus solidus]|uniref:Reverse transcriptase domain-containing protein n=1 Tax=Schistocephalus solidus TaxID=70667 RepID=A0A183S846_SCHSO|nr:unnamed protein product [Schistocephalus solidus]